MSQLVSYAQNFEDVILHRALAKVDRGNYIDVGAQSALVDSVSRMFHDLGWSGVHVEPVGAYADELESARPGDKVLRVAVGDDRGTITFHEVPSTGLSTIDAEIAAGHRNEGFEVLERETPVVTLDDVFYASGFDEIHWLKIDVEGFEASVIRGWHGDVRPWVVVVESTLPLSQVESHDAWESMLLDKGYTFAYFDGLNRFYVSATHRELLGTFGPGPNVFDDFSLSGTASQPFTRLLKSELASLRESLAQRDNELASLQQHLAQAEADSAYARQVFEQATLAYAELNNRSVEMAGEMHRHRQQAHYWWVTAEQLREELTAIKSSRSWRLTAPIRGLRAGNFSFRTFVKRSVRSVLARIMIRTVRRPLLVRLARTLLSVAPGLKSRLRNIGVAYGFIDTGLRPVTVLEGHARPMHPALSLGASKVLRDLDAAIKRGGV